mgnify:FL=1
MALTRSNEFDTGTVLTETKIEGEFDNIYNNALSLISPLTGALDTGATGQIVFPATQTASAGANTLDDYEEGTWTPTLTFATPGNLSVAYTTRVGRYTKIGRLVTLTFTIVTSTFTHTTASGNLQTTGIPFTAATMSGHLFSGVVGWGGITKASYTQVIPMIDSNTAIIIFPAAGSGQSVSNVSAGDVPTGGTIQLYGTISYNEV